MSVITPDYLLSVHGTCHLSISLESVLVTGAPDRDDGGDVVRAGDLNILVTQVIPSPLRFSAACPPLHCAGLPHRLAVAAVVVVDAGALQGDDGGHGGARG